MTTVLMRNANNVFSYVSHALIIQLALLVTALFQQEYILSAFVLLVKYSIFNNIKF
jgi:hypothetical protein